MRRLQREEEGLRWRVLGRAQRRRIHVFCVRTHVGVGAHHGTAQVRDELIRLRPLRDLLRRLLGLQGGSSRTQREGEGSIRVGPPCRIATASGAAYRSTPRACARGSSRPAAEQLLPTAAPTAAPTAKKKGRKRGESENSHEREIARRGSTHQKKSAPRVVVCESQHASCGRACGAGGARRGVPCWPPPPRCLSCRLTRCPCSSSPTA